MQCHRPVRMHKSGRYSQGHDPAQQTEILKEGGGAAKCLFRVQERRSQTDVHGNAAELEWKIPPVVVLVVFYVIEKKLFVDLGKCQKNTAGKEQMQTERFGARPQLPGGKGGEWDADQHKY